MEEREGGMEKAKSQIPGTAREKHANPKSHAKRSKGDWFCGGVQERRLFIWFPGAVLDHGGNRRRGRDRARDRISRRGGLRTRGAHGLRANGGRGHRCVARQNSTRGV